MGQRQVTRSNITAIFILILNYFIWGTNYVLGKFAMDSFPPTAVAGLRYIISTMILLVIANRYLREKMERSDYIHLFVIGFLGYFFQTMVNNIGLHLIGASSAALINSLNPVSITVVSALVLRERIDGIKILGVILAIIGTAVIVGNPNQHYSLLGVVLSLSAVILWAFASVSIKKLTFKYHPVNVVLRASLISVIFYIPTTTVSLWNITMIDINRQAILAIVYLGVIGTALSSYLWSSALDRLEASFCSLFYPLQALFSSILSFVFFKETVESSFVLGFIIITVNVVIVSIHNIKKSQTIPIVAEDESSHT